MKIISDGYYDIDKGREIIVEAEMELSEI